MSVTEAGRASLPMRIFLRFLAAVERIGNKLPQPFWLFAILAAATVALSAVLSVVGVSAVSPVDGQTVAVKSLLSSDGLQVMLGQAVENYVTFPPLGIVVVVVLGVAVAESSGMFHALLRRTVTRARGKWLTFAVTLTGVCASVMSAAAFVVIIPMAALVYKGAGRSPVLGIVVGFTSTFAGYNASLIVQATDALLAGITTAAAQTIDPNYVVSPLSNYYFTAFSAIVLAILITITAEGIVAKRTDSLISDANPDTGELSADPISQNERLALRRVGIVVVAAVVVIAACLAPPASPLRGEDQSVLSSPIISGVAYVIGILFIIIGYVYGRTMGTIPRLRNVPDAMAGGLRDLAPVLVLFFAASQFIAYFGWTNLAEVLAIRSADLLASLDVPSGVLLLGFVAIVVPINLLITSGSAQWTIMGAIFVPTFMFLGVSPEVTQAAFRVADSPTNVLTPVSPYFILALGFLRQYRREGGIGTLISLSLPISLVMLVGWIVLYFGWWALGIPFGPGTPMHYPPPGG